MELKQLQNQLTNYRYSFNQKWKRPYPVRHSKEWWSFNCDVLRGKDLVYKVKNFGVKKLVDDLSGNQTEEFFKHIQCEKVLLIDISQRDGKGHFPQRYQNAKQLKQCKGFPKGEEMKWITDGVDLIFTCEIPYNYILFQFAKNKGIKTILNYNWEFLDYLRNPEYPMPDMLLNPSTWHLEKTKKLFSEKCKVEHLPFPVNREVLPFEKKTKAKTFIHIAGYQLFEDRNGTESLIQSLPHIQNKDIKIIIYSQHELPKIEDKRVVVLELNIKNYWELYEEGDVLILPRRYGGQSLQLNEAMSRGMIPLMPNMDPQNSFLCNDNMFEVTTKTIRTRAEIDCAIINPHILANSIDKLANMNTEKIQTLSYFSDIYADTISWANMKEKYINLFKGLL